MGMLFAASTASLGVAFLEWADLARPWRSVRSCAAARLDWHVWWQILRRHVSEDLFRQLFLIVLGGLGLLSVLDNPPRLVSW